MTCKYNDKLKDYLEEKLSKEDMNLIEKHIDVCQDCQQRLDNMLSEDLDLKGSSPDVSDEVLVDKIKAHRKGRRRIVIYGIFGFLLGLFSRFYTSDDFIVTKAIMAVPYKLAEFVLGIFFSRNVLTGWQREGFPFHYQELGYFPFNPIVSVMAELVTPAIIGVFIAAMVGYLASDKRVFQRKKIVSFIIIGALVMSVWIASLSGLYSYSMAKIRDMEDIKAVTVYQVSKNSSSWLIKLDKEALSQPKYAKIRNEIISSELIKQNSYRETTEGYGLLITFSGGGTMSGHLDPVDKVLIMQNGNTYQMTQQLINTLDNIKEER